MAPRARARQVGPETGALALHRPCRRPRHLLLVHYHFLPVHNVAVKRLLGYAKHLPDFGWQTLVLTREWHGTHEADTSWGLTWEPHLERDVACSIHRVPWHPPPPRPRRRRPARAASLSPAAPPADGTAPPADGTASPTDDAAPHAGFPARLAAKLERMRRMLFEGYPDGFTGWVGPAVEAGVRVAREHGVDLIMSYCPPESNHLVARRLARRLGVPWVAFFGDLWGFLDPPLPAHSLEGLFRRRWHRWCLAPAAACAAVSPAMVDFLERAYGKPTRLIHTGFDPEEFPAQTTPAQPRDRLLISHVGSIYPGDQRPDLLFNGLDRLLREHPEIAPRLEVRFVGSKCDDRLRTLLAGRPAARVCTIRPGVDSASAIRLVRESHALLAFTCTAHRDRFGTLSFPTKIFEAVGARRPILAIPADGDWVDALLAHTRGGTSARDAADVAVRLLDWFTAWNRDGRVPYHADPDAIAEYSRDRQVANLARLFDSVCRS